MEVDGSDDFPDFNGWFLGEPAVSFQGCSLAKGYTVYSLNLTAIAPENRPFTPKGKDRLPTTNFQVRAVCFRRGYPSLGGSKKQQMLLVILRDFPYNAWSLGWFYNDPWRFEIWSPGPNVVGNGGTKNPCNRWAIISVCFFLRGGGGK